MACFQDLETLLLEDGKSAPETLAMLGTPFISMAIMEDGQISTRVTGSSKYNSETIFQACSISKSITASAVIKFAQQDRLDIDTSVAAYLTSTQLLWISTLKTKHLVKSITSRMLLSHTSGLANMDSLGIPPIPLRYAPFLQE